MYLRPALVLLLAASVHAQPSVVLADGRDEAPEAVEAVAYWTDQAALRQATQAARSHWRALDPTYEEEVRILDATDGAFTAPAARQTAVLYLMSLWPRCCPRMGIAVVEDGRLVHNAAFERPAQSLDAVPDLDGDGRDELLTTGSFGMGGQTSTTLTWLAFGGDGLRDRGSAPLFDSDCAGSGREGSTSVRILAVPGPSGPTFQAERYAMTCTSAAWLPRGVEALTFSPPDGAADGAGYVALPLDAGVEPAVPEAAGARTEAGRLARGDETLSSGEFVDEYAVACRRGIPLTVDLRSADFDPYLILGLPDGTQLDNDDHEGDQTRSLIETTPAVDGPCRLLVTSYAVGETGAYALTILGGE